MKGAVFHYLLVTCIFFLEECLFKSDAHFFNWLLNYVRLCWVLVTLLQPRVPRNKLTQKDNADRGVQLITQAGPRQSLLLAKDPDQFL